MRNEMFSVFLIDGHFASSQSSIVRLDYLVADEVNFILSLLSRQECCIDFVVRAIRGEEEQEIDD